MNRISKQVPVWMFASLLAASASVAAIEEDRMRNWQLALLMNPSEQQQKVEERGRVMIYDGMHTAVINRALDEQFDRIDHMMFTNTILTDEAGNPLRDPETGLVMVEEDGCE